MVGLIEKQFATQVRESKEETVKRTLAAGVRHGPRADKKPLRKLVRRGFALIMKKLSYTFGFPTLV